MARGFTLIEMLITIMVMMSLLMVAGPSFGHLKEKARVERLAQELKGIFIQTKSHAVLLNQPVYLNLIQNPANNAGVNNKGQWALAASRHATPLTQLSQAHQNAEILLNGADFDNVTLVFPLANQFSSLSQIEFEPLNGKPAQSSSFTFYVDPAQKLKLVFSNVTGRIRICGDGGQFYDYPIC